MTDHVNIKITPEGWITTVVIDGETASEVWQLASTGAKSLSGDLEEEDIVSNELYEALSSRSFLDMARALINRKERSE